MAQILRLFFIVIVIGITNTPAMASMAEDAINAGLSNIKLGLDDTYRVEADMRTLRENKKNDLITYSEEIEKIMNIKDHKKSVDSVLNTVKAVLKENNNCQTLKYFSAKQVKAVLVFECLKNNNIKIMEHINTVEGIAKDLKLILYILFHEANVCLARDSEKGKLQCWNENSRGWNNQIEKIKSMQADIKSTIDIIPSDLLCRGAGDEAFEKLSATSGFNCFWMHFG